MNHLSSHPLQKGLWAFFLVAAPVLLIISQFFWSENGRITTEGGWIQILSFFCWIPAFHAMFSLLSERMPRYAIVGFIVACYACIGGNNFGMDGMYTYAFGLQSMEEAGRFHAEIGNGILPVLFIPGILFPLSLIGLGIMLWRTQSVPTAVAILLIIGGICFPISRIPRIELIAHIDNFILLIPHVMIARQIWKARDKQQEFSSSGELSAVG